MPNDNNKKDSKLESSITGVPEENLSSTGGDVSKQDLLDAAVKVKLLSIAEDADKKILSELKIYTDLELNIIRTQVKNFTTKIKKEEEALKEKLEAKIDNSKLSVIETLGIFVALFTFISIDIQILKTTFNLSALVGFVFITLGALLFFVIALHILVVSNTNKIELKFILGFLMSILLLGGGVYLVNKSVENNYMIIDKDQFDKNYNQNITKSQIDLDILKNCLKLGGWSKCF